MNYSNYLNCPLIQYFYIFILYLYYIYDIYISYLKFYNFKLLIKYKNLTFYRRKLI